MTHSVMLDQKIKKQKERLSLALFSHYFGNGRYSKKENDLGE
jgi:hypothetical protein